MYLKVNDITLYYEKSGKGNPILLLHGNGESNKIFDILRKQLEEQYTVYAIDSRGHGNSSKVKSLDYNSMAEDIIQFIQVLQINQPILYGFSDGGILGLIIASKHPTLLSKLIISGANVTPDGLKRKYIKLFRFIYFITKSSNFNLMLTQPNISEKELAKITTETIILAGSKDLIEEKHTKYIAKCITNSKLQIINGEGHESYVVNTPKLYEILKPYLITS